MTEFAEPEQTTEQARPAAAVTEPASAPMHVGATYDDAEREADRVADVVLRRLRGATGAAPHAAPDGRTAVRRSPLPSATPRVGMEGGELDHETTSAIESRRGAGSPLEPGVRHRFEGAFGSDLSGVRVHTDQAASRLNRAVSARAFTTGRDIFFGAGQYRPGTAEGDRVLAHELAHTQQQGGVRRAVRRLDDQVADQSYQAMVSLDYGMLTAIAEKVPIIKSIAVQFGGDQSQLEHIKQLILVSPLKPAAIEKLINEAVAKLAKPASAAAAVAGLAAKLGKGKKQSSNEVYAFIEKCRAIHEQYYRSAYKTEEAKTGEVSHMDLDAHSKKYDTSGKNDYDAQLTTVTKGFFKDSVNKHSLNDVVKKVDLVNSLVLVNTHAPDRAPTGSGQGPKLQAEQRRAVGVAGAGPVGLMAAIEARLAGADTYLFEARGEYVRRQVVVLDQSTIAKFNKYGVRWELVDPANKDRAGEPGTVAVRYIEEALRDRALELGVQFRTGWTLLDAEKGEGAARTDATFEVAPDEKAPKGTKATTKHVELDLLVIAAGAGIRKPGKDGSSLADRLGFTYDVHEAKDYTAIGLFEPNQSGGASRYGATKEEKESWAYRFNTPKITYVLQQVPKEVYDALMAKGEDERFSELRTFLKDVAGRHFEMQDARFATDTSPNGKKIRNVDVFPIEVIQAKKMVNEKLGALLIGDSAATPHPHSGSGLNTGVRELDALGELVADLRTDALKKAKQDPKDKGKKGEDDEAPADVAKALNKYNDDIRTLTTQMVGKALKILAKEHSRYLKKAIAALERDYGSLLASDFRLGHRIDAMKSVIEPISTNKSAMSYENQCEYCIDARKELDRIENDLIGITKGRPKPKGAAKTDDQAGTGMEKEKDRVPL